MKIRAKVVLKYKDFGVYTLKRWSKKEGFYIEYFSYQGIPAYKVSQGNSLVECINNLQTDECNGNSLWLLKKDLFSEKISESIIENFILTDEEKSYIIELSEWADF